MHRQYFKVLVRFGVVFLLFVFGFKAFAEEQKYTIALVPGLTTNPFYIAMYHGAKQAADELHVKLVWQGAPEWDVPKQTAVVNALVAQRVSALVIAPTDVEALKEPLRQAVAAGIVVITVDTDINDPSSQIRLVSIASDNYKGGWRAGEALAKAINGKGQVALLSAMEGVTTNEQRMKGFKDAIQKYPDIKLVTTQYSNEDQAKASEQMQSVLISFPGLSGAFAIDTPTAHGAALGLKAAGGKKVILVGFDAQPAEIEDVVGGDTSMLVAQAPFAMGYMGIQTAYNVLQGFLSECPGGKLITGTFVIDQKNVKSSETQKWIYQTELPK
jgi:ribose transport system substrate-binding protein